MVEGKLNLIDYFKNEVVVFVINIFSGKGVRMDEGVICVSVV